jgi:ribosomal protein L37AE/L43A
VYHESIPDVLVAPKACPFCGSADVTTTAKDVNVSTYWRCTACGQIWNAGRLQRPDRPDRPGRSFR